MIKTECVKAHEIIDSRGNPTVEVDVILCKIYLHVVRKGSASGLNITYRVKEE